MGTLHLYMRTHAEDPLSLAMGWLKAEPSSHPSNGGGPKHRVKTLWQTVRLVLICGVIKGLFEGPRGKVASHMLVFAVAIPMGQMPPFQRSAFSGMLDAWSGRAVGSFNEPFDQPENRLG